MKRFASLVLGLCFVLGVAADAADKKWTVGISCPSATHGYMANVNYWANKAKEDWAKWDPSVTIDIKFSGNSAQQVSDLEDLLTKGVDAIVVFPHDVSVTNVVEQAYRSGVYTVVLDRGVSKEGIYDIYLTNDDEGMARTGMEYICKTLNYEGDVVLIEGVPSPINTTRTQAMMDVAAQYPGIKVIDQQPGDWNRQRSLAVMENFLQKHKKIDAVFTIDDDMMIGALQAYKESGRDDIKVFMGGAGLKEVLQMIMDDSNPMVKADCTYPPSAIAVATSYAILGMKGEKLHPHIYQAGAMPRRIIIPAELITKENAKDFYNPDTPL